MVGWTLYKLEGQGTKQALSQPQAPGFQPTHPTLPNQALCQIVGGTNLAGKYTLKKIRFTSSQVAATKPLRGNWRVSSEFIIRSQARFPKKKPPPRRGPFSNQSSTTIVFVNSSRRYLTPKALRVSWVMPLPKPLSVWKAFRASLVWQP